MTLAGFLASPWKSSHPSYEKSLADMRPAPENATAEVVLASMYRSVGFASHAEKDVPAAGREFDRASAKHKKHKKGGIGGDTWRTVLHGALQSPKQRRQSSKRFLQLCPIVPDASLYSGSARLAGNSWNPGDLVRRMVAFGCWDSEDASSFWKELYDGLSVGTNDDVWARWLQNEFESRKKAKMPVWEQSTFDLQPRFERSDLLAIKIPARQFVVDLRAVLEAKSTMTRRQWISIVEAVTRVASVAHVMWLCEVNARLWQAANAALAGRAVGEPSATLREIFGQFGQPLVYGAAAKRVFRESASTYLHARLGLNLLLWTLAEKHGVGLSLDSLTSVHSALTTLSAMRADFDYEAFQAVYSELCDRTQRDLLCKRGVGNNIVEFCRYTLGQRQTADDTLRGYDQGYALRKRGENANAHTVVSLGPVALLAFAHCCLLEAAGPRSVMRLAEHLAQYGLRIDQDHIADGDLGMKLRTLGLVLDSPDAESGMLLTPPFEMPATRGAYT